MTNETIRGYQAIELAERDRRWELRKYADPTEGACALTAEAAREIAAIDPSLVYAVRGEPCGGLHAPPPGREQLGDPETGWCVCQAEPDEPCRYLSRSPRRRSAAEHRAD